MSDKPAQFEFADAYAALPVAVALLEDGRVTWCNRAFADLYQTGADRVTGRSVWDFVAPEDRPRLEPRYHGRMQGEPVATRYQMVVVRADGTRRQVDVEARLLDERRTVVVLWDLGAPRPDRDLATALSEGAARVQRARTPDAVIDAASDVVRSAGLRAYFSRNRGGRLALVRGEHQDPVIAAFEALIGRSADQFSTPEVRPELERLLAIPTRARFVDDFPALVRTYLRAAGVEPAPLADAMAAPDYQRAISAPLLSEGVLWGVLTVTGERLSANDVGPVALFAAQVGSALEIAGALQSLQQTNLQLAAVHAVAAAGAESELRRLLPNLLAIAAEGTGSTTAAIWLSEEAGLVLAGAHGFATGMLGRYQEVGAGQGAGLFDLELPRTLSLADLPAPLRADLSSEGLRQMAVVPMRLRGKRVGVMLLGRVESRPYSGADLQGGELIADQVVIQIEKARLIEAERRRVHDLQLMLDVGRVITATLDPDEILLAAATSLARMIDASDAFIWLYDPLTRELYGAATSTPEYWEHFRQVRLRIDTESTLAGRAMLAREPVRVEDASRPSAINSELNRTYQVRSLLGLPLLLRDQPIGAVTIGDRYRARSWTDGEVERTTVIASQVAVAVANARLFDDLKRSYDKLAQAREELVKRERLAALGELSAVVAHEVRNPLGVIFNSLGSLRKAVRGNGDAELLLQIVGEESDRLNRIVSDLLDFARPHEASLRLGGLESVLESARETALALTGGAVAIELELPRHLPRVALDARMLRQAFINLLVNAVQASGRGTRVTVRGEREERAVRLDVTDAGPGIPAALRQRIFQPFFTTKATGTGLGLAVVKRVVEAHRGEVWLSSPEGRGTTFSVRLPLPPEAELHPPS